MRIIKVLDQRDYLDSWDKIERYAVRAIIKKDNLIAMVKSKKEGFYKFPGGGVEVDEDHIDTLIRETQEESGLVIKENTVREYGFFVECRKSLFEDAIFEQKSYYYTAEVEDVLVPTNLDDYEKELEYELEWVDINTAYEVNDAFEGIDEYTYIVRETIVLRELIVNDKPKRVYLTY
jgi:8-oxo-dGTP pyrophosphatase MutT (NUDIX family)